MLWILCLKKSFGCVGIVKNNKLVGILTDGDIRRILQNNHNYNFENTTVSSFMNKNPITITNNELMVKAINIMNEKKITSIFIVDEKQLPTGIIHMHDCLKAGLI